MPNSTDNLKQLCNEIKKLKDAPLVEKYPDREGGLLIPNHNIADLKALASEYERLKENERVTRIFLANIRLELEAA